MSDHHRVQCPPGSGHPLVKAVLPDNRKSPPIGIILGALLTRCVSPARNQVIDWNGHSWFYARPRRATDRVHALRDRFRHDSEFGTINASLHAGSFLPEIRSDVAASLDLDSGSARWSPSIRSLEDSHLSRCCKAVGAWANNDVPPRVGEALMVRGIGIASE